MHNETAVADIDDIDFSPTLASKPRLSNLLLGPQGVNRLSERLPNVKVVRRVPHNTFNHLDFLYARDGRPLLYDEVMTAIEEVFHEEQID